MNAPYALSVDDRVELHPATDAWMAGNRYGTVERITFWRRDGREHVHVHVRMDRTGKLLGCPPELIGEVVA